MSCPSLKYQGGSLFDHTDDDYLCRQTGQTMDLYSNKVKYTCDGNYESCPIYKNS